MLEDARRLGFLGPGPVEAHLGHAAGFAIAVRTGCRPSGLRAAVDLGSGGGVPGLPLALEFSEVRWVLVEVGARRAAFLRAAVEALALADRVTVAVGRAEELGRQPQHRSAFQLAVARGFGPPAVTAECAAPFLEVAGRAVVSDPPGGGGRRWPDAGLALVGMAPGPAVQARGRSYQVVIQEAACPARYPRRVGIPAKRPLF